MDAISNAQIAELQSSAHDLQASIGGALGGDGFLQRHGVLLQGAQHIGHVLERRDDRAAILRVGLIIGGARSKFPLRQRTAVEDRLDDAAGDGPEGGLRGEQIAKLECGATRIGGERDVWQPVEKLHRHCRPDRERHARKF